ncbi:Uncharacterised protein [Mycobacteroides abscessus subsp. abscessus]|nr:Uncharacterised protein [Mycobacteroides abscessus subsp. abscessus]
MGAMPYEHYEHTVEVLAPLERPPIHIRDPTG